MEEDNAWVFDSLVTFLNGPIWNAPLQSFIEEKSLIFEPNAEDNEGYKNIFDEFKNLVDFMLGNFMEDIGITAEQFENACKESKRYQVAFDPNSFEQIWAANDFEMFKKMMTQRNVELQLQALELIEQKYGITPESFVPHNHNENVREIPANVEKSSDLEQHVMEEVAKNFNDEREEIETPKKIENIEEEKVILEREKEVLEKVLKETKEKQLPDVAAPSAHAIEPTVKKEPSITEKKDSQPTEKKDEIDALELKKRQDYLRAQRDKLVALKKEARRKQLDKGTTKLKERPKSAKAAEAVLTGGKSNIAPQQLQFRKTLAERLRAEVVAANE
ncbi:cilia- and flagella-associated protein 36 [Diorhabda carinulata]|uniref:cilia- and flagella-associated protein 36 n=1 Tax=Diorhabda carinulata TaxID=1163345 RepID=UPI0025A129A7|nr:cilia- and flagella-associated protein 36 [Diorhabda carinulata]